MLRLCAPLIVALTLTACISGRPDQEELRRAGSLSHSFGAVFVVSGLTNGLAAAGTGALIASDEAEISTAVPISLATSAVLQLILGGVIIAQGNDMFERPREQRTVFMQPALQRLSGDVSYEPTSTSSATR